MQHETADAAEIGRRQHAQEFRAAGAFGDESAAAAARSGRLVHCAVFDIAEGGGDAQGEMRVAADEAVLEGFGVLALEALVAVEPVPELVVEEAAGSGEGAAGWEPLVASGEVDDSAVMG